MAKDIRQIDLSGIGGLAPYFAGDKPYIASSPNLRYYGSKGQLADGIYNPLASIGYMNPANISKDLLTGTMTSEFIASVYTPTGNKQYFLENGTKLAYLDALDDTSVSETTLLTESSVFKDGELYEINDAEAILYTYLNNTPTTNNVPNLNLGFFTTDTSKGGFQLASKVFETVGTPELYYATIATGESQKLSQKFSTVDFVTARNYDVTGIRLRLKCPYLTTQTWTLKVGIQTDNAGYPSGTYVANAYTTVAASTIPAGEFGFMYFTFPSKITLDENTPYHIVVEPTVWAEIGANEGLYWRRSTAFSPLYDRGVTGTYDGTNWTQLYFNGEPYYSNDFAIILNQYNYLGFAKRTPSNRIPAIDATANTEKYYDTQFVAYANGDTAGATSLLCNKPTGTTQNDIMFALVTSSSSYSNSTPSGWTLLAQNTTSGQYYEVYYKVAGGSEPTDYTWGFSGSQKIRITIATYRYGFDTANPIAASSNTLYTTNNVTLRAASVTTSSESNILHIGANYDTGAVRTFTAPSALGGFTEDVDAGSSSSDFSHSFSHVRWASSGATGDVNATINSNSTTKHAFLIALTPETETITHTHTSVSANNPLLVVGVYATEYDTSNFTVTCDGIPMILVAGTGLSSTGLTYLYYLVGLAAGAHTITVVPTLAIGDVVVMSASYTGVEQMNPLLNNNDDTETTDETPPIPFTIDTNYQLPIVLAAQSSKSDEIEVNVYGTERSFGTNHNYAKLFDALFADNNYVTTPDYEMELSSLGTNEDYAWVQAVFRNAQYTRDEAPIPPVLQADTSDILHSSQNGLLYWLTGSRIHQFDGFITGGDFGTVRKDVFRLPSYIKIVDVVESNSLMYIAIENANVSNPDLRMFTSDICGVYVWDKKSTVEGVRNFYAAPGARSIKKLFIDGNGEVCMISVGNNRLTELRTISNSKFKVKYNLGLNSYPNRRDSLGYMNEVATWLGRDGIIYGYGKVLPIGDDSIFKLGDTTTWAAGALTTSLFNLGNVADAGTGASVDKAFVGYLDGSTPKLAAWYPSGTGTINGVVQTGHIGNNYSLIEHLPDMSTVQYVDIRCAPTDTGSEVIATIKYYFNNQTSNPITKEITKTQASRGYVRHELNKPYINSIQMKIEYNTTNTLSSSNNFRPSNAIIYFDDTPGKG